MVCSHICEGKPMNYTVMGMSLIMVDIIPVKSGLKHSPWWLNWSSHPYKVSMGWDLSQVEAYAFTMTHIPHCDRQWSLNKTHFFFSKAFNGYWVEDVHKLTFSEISTRCKLNKDECIKEKTNLIWPLACLNKPAVMNLMYVLYINTG